MKDERWRSESWQAERQALHNLVQVALVLMVVAVIVVTRWP